MRSELRVGKGGQFCAVPARAQQKIVGLLNRLQARTDTLLHGLIRSGIAQRPAHDRFRDGQRVLRPMREFVQQQLLPRVPSLLRLLPFRYINEGDDNSVNLVLDRTIWTKAHQKPVSIYAFDRALYGSEIGKHAMGILGERCVLKTMREVGDRPTFVTISNIEDVSKTWGEAVDAQVGSQEKCRNVRRAH